MPQNKKAGVLLNISSINSPYGIGTFGLKAYEFADFLVKAKQSYWQVLPLNQTSYGDSPYQSPSAYAGNPYFIDLDMLKEEGLLNEEDYVDVDFGNEQRYCDYGKLFFNRYKVLNKAFERFVGQSDYIDFTKENEFWLDDYALFMALKEKHDYRSFIEWEDKYKYRKSTSINKFVRENGKKIDFWKFVQFEFYKQFYKFKDYINSKGIKLIGDMPIYLALDSSEVWSHSEYFLVKNCTPKLVAGVPPDAFTEDGQLWGNPIYDWSYMKKTNYQFWKDRIGFAKKMYDLLRIDHFRGFDSYYAIPFGDVNAKNGVWKKGPGKKLFDEVSREIDVSFIIAEDLGYLTPSVRRMLKATGYPGMKILQFGFSGNVNDEYLPKQYKKNSVCYTGTHDNETSQQFVDHLENWQRDFFNQMLSEIDEDTPVYKMIGAIMKSKSNLAVVPMQDYLQLGVEARMNFPSKPLGYWKWRVVQSDLTTELSKKLSKMMTKYHRK